MQRDHFFSIDEIILKLRLFWMRISVRVAYAHIFATTAAVREITFKGSKDYLLFPPSVETGTRIQSPLLLHQTRFHQTCSLLALTWLKFFNHY